MATETPTVQKTELVRQASRKSQIGLTYEQMHDALESILDTIVENIFNGNTVLLQGLGRLVPVIKPGGVARNPRTGEQVEYEDRLTLKFQVNNNFKLSLRTVDTKSMGNNGASDPKRQVGSKTVQKKPADQVPAKSTRRRR